MQIFQILGGRSSAADKQLNYDLLFTQSINFLSRFCDASAIDTRRNYQLRSIIVHQGQSTTSGHYTTLTMRNKKWFYFNDQVAPRYLEDPSRFLITHDEMHPYVLIYVDSLAAVDDYQQVTGKPSLVKSLSRISLKDLEENGMFLDQLITVEL